MTGLGARREAAIELIMEFCRRADEGRGEAIAELFTSDATVEAPHFNLVGRDEIHHWFAERAKPGARLARHIVTNLRVVADGEDAVTVEAYQIVLVKTPDASAARAAVGTTRDRILFADDRPLFTSRTLVVDFEMHLPFAGQAA